MNGLGSWVAFAILGNTGLYFELNDIVPVADILSEEGTESAAFATMLGLPFGSGALVVFMALLVIFLATTLDSSSYTMASVATKELHPKEEPARWHRLFRTLVLGGLAIFMIYPSGDSPVKSFSFVLSFPLLFAIPLIVVFILMFISLYKWLGESETEQDSAAHDVTRSESREKHVDDQSRQEAR